MGIVTRKERGIGGSDFQEGSIPKRDKRVEIQNSLIFAYLPLFSTLFCSNPRQRSYMTVGKSTEIHILSLNYMSQLI